MIDKPAHSSIGASSLHRLSKCPGSKRLIENIKSFGKIEEQESECDKRETDAHALAEYILKKLAVWGGKIAKLDKKQYPDYAVEELESIVIYVNFVMSLSIIGFEIKIEEKLDLSHVHPEAFGTADAIVWNPMDKVLHVIDYKHGAGVFVEADWNLQALFYALGAAKKYPDVKKIVIAIVQPRCRRSYENDSNGIRAWEIDPLVLFDFEQELKEIYEKVFSPDAKTYPGSHCRFCPASHVDKNGDFLCPSLEISDGRSNRFLNFQKLKWKNNMNNNNVDVLEDNSFIRFYEAIHTKVKLFKSPLMVTPKKITRGYIHDRK